MSKNEQALLVTEQVLTGIENKTLSTSSALLKCLKISRLLNDTDSMIWLQYEYKGYPRDLDGSITKEAFEYATSHGRGYLSNRGERKIFLKLASELEEEINISRNLLSNSPVNNSTRTLFKKNAYNEKNLSILRSSYYDYALKVNIELKFGNVANDIFSAYRVIVERNFGKFFSPEKAEALEDKINSNNPEMYSQALGTCRRLFEHTASSLFNKYFPDYKEKMYKTKSGVTIDISGNHYRNQLSAVIEYLQERSVNKTLIGSDIIYLLDWMEKLNNKQSKGVHSNVTKEEAMRCIIHTYICLGDIVSLES